MADATDSDQTDPQSGWNQGTETTRKTGEQPPENGLCVPQQLKYYTKTLVDCQDDMIGTIAQLSEC